MALLREGMRALRALKRPSGLRVLGLHMRGKVIITGIRGAALRADEALCGMGMSGGGGGGA